MFNKEENREKEINNSSYSCPGGGDDDDGVRQFEFRYRDKGKRSDCGGRFHRSRYHSGSGKERRIRTLR